MTRLVSLFFLAFSILSIEKISAQTSAKSQDLAKISFTEGILESRVTVAGIDMSFITEGLDYSKDNLKEQMMALYAKIPPKEAEAFQAMIEKNPMMAFAVMLTPPKGELYVRKGVTTVKTKGVGYYLEHYHNTLTDEAFIHTASLVKPGEEATAQYHPSAGYKKLFSADKLITSEKFNVKKEPGTTVVAGYACNKSVYTPKTLEAQPVSQGGMTAPQIYKLVVYSSAAISKEINFSHPYYLPEDHGILQIDIFLDEGNTPSMVYQITAVKPGVVTDEQLMIKKTDPLYDLEDMQYGMKVLGIMMGGMTE